MASISNPTVLRIHYDPSLRPDGSPSATTPEAKAPLPEDSSPVVGRRSRRASFPASADQVKRPLLSATGWRRRPAGSRRSEMPGPGDSLRRRPHPPRQQRTPEADPPMSSSLSETARRVPAGLLVLTLAACSVQPVPLSVDSLAPGDLVFFGKPKPVEPGGATQLQVLQIHTDLVEGDALVAPKGHMPPGLKLPALGGAQQMGLDQPVWVQYGRYVTGLFRGDLGESSSTGRPTSSRAVAPSAASPTTARSGSRAITSATPRRKSGWRSTTRTRTGALLRCTTGPIMARREGARAGTGEPVPARDR